MNERELADLLEQSGWGIIPPQQFRIDFETRFKEIWEKSKNCTMTSPERGYSLYTAVTYIAKRNIPGAFVECGVWKGGSSMIAALTFMEMGLTDRELYLYDTFEGMTRPTQHDRVAWNDSPVTERWEERFGSWVVSRDEVQNNLEKTGYPRENINLIEGDVLQTLNQRRPGKIALLRLDTDWYESTAFELEVLYPLLVPGGVLIIDDYGHFTGAKKAVDEYFDDRTFPLLSRVDYTGRMGIKI